MKLALNPKSGLSIMAAIGLTVIFALPAAAAGGQTRGDAGGNLSDWVWIVYDWDNDGYIDYGEYIAFDELQKARENSRMRSHQGARQDTYRNKERAQRNFSAKRYGGKDDVFGYYGSNLAPIEPHFENGIRYISGGVGRGEREAMRKALNTNDYNLKIVFAAESGPYLSLIPVRISDVDGNTLIDAESAGPWFFADLPRGEYRVTATYEGRSKTREVTVNGRMNTLRFFWDYEGQLRTQAQNRR